MALKLNNMARKPTDDALSAIFVICESSSRVLWENAGPQQRRLKQQDEARSTYPETGSRKTKPEKISRGFLSMNIHVFKGFYSLFTAIYLHISQYIF